MVFVVDRRQRRIRSFDTKRLFYVNDECCESTTKTHEVVRYEKITFR